MKKIVIYKSKKGYTEYYAKLIGESVDADVYRMDQITLEVLADYDTVIFGGGIYSDKINGINEFTSMIKKELDKNIIIFGVGMSPIFNEYIDKLYEKNIENKLIHDVKFFFFRGGVELNRLSGIERKVLVAFLKVTEIFRESYSEVTSNSKATDDLIDFTSPDYAKDLIEYVEKLN